jgi:hypothetical protein
MIEILAFCLYDTCYRAISMGMGLNFLTTLACSKARDARYYLWFRFGA